MRPMVNGAGGWCERGPQTVGAFLDGRGSTYDDRELDNADDEDHGTLKPTLAAPNRHHNREHWAAGARGDHEREECTDRELVLDIKPRSRGIR
ncbi:hypothetical protein [Mesorhizobium sp. B2-8-9]|uniref:hypothetical protein n=1 Tax=Mesorhizobium sp. B2-8-9 TaxID=2589899 RepID=UPI001129FB0F|nr:hypothetical protein [Mesorhizobium sp. B2-8-9]TPI72527.1 hypothetical protein FJ423_27025 [Mesorhizobium sp. B2-8-9]